MPSTWPSSAPPPPASSTRSRASIAWSMTSHQSRRGRSSGSEGWIGYSWLKSAAQSRARGGLADFCFASSAGKKDTKYQINVSLETFVDEIEAPKPEFRDQAEQGT